MSEREGEPGRQNQPMRSWAEWTVFAIAALIVVSITGLLVWQWVATGPAPPIFEISEEIRETETGPQLLATVTNVGGSTAEMVEVTAEGVRGGGTQTIELLSPGESARIVFTFDGATAARVSVTAYQEP